MHYYNHIKFHLSWSCRSSDILLSEVLGLSLHISMYRFRNFDRKYLVQFLYCKVPINQESHLVRPIIFLSYRIKSVQNVNLLVFLVNN